MTLHNNKVQSNEKREKSDALTLALAHAPVSEDKGCSLFKRMGKRLLQTGTTAGQQGCTPVNLQTQSSDQVPLSICCYNYTHRWSFYSRRRSYSRFVVLVTVCLSFFIFFSLTRFFSLTAFYMSFNTAVWP